MRIPLLLAESLCTTDHVFIQQVSSYALGINGLCVTEAMGPLCVEEGHRHW